MSIASPTQREKSPHNQPAGSPLQRFIAGARDIYLRQYRRISTTSLRGVALLLLLIAIGTTSFGVIMVLSASSVEQISRGLSPFSQVTRQAVFAVLGLVALAITALIPVHWYRNKWVLYSLMIVAILVQLLTAFIGREVNGNRNWIVIGPIQVQPSEFGKLVFALWGGWVLAQQGNISRSLRKGLFPLLFGFVPLVGFILLGDDVGTVLVYALMLLGILWFAGLSNKALGLGLGVAAFAGAVAVLTSANRIARVLGTFGHCEGATCDQANAGLAALATGGFWGVGLGRSRQKYNYLPEAHNDYIFAIIGEELGLIGTCLIILLYLGLVYCCVRIMVRTADRFIALTTGAIMVWLTGQAVINIAMVAGLLPVIGIPLPLISYGGSSLMTSLAAIGVLIAFARQTPLLPVTGGSSAVYYSGAPDMRDEKRRRPLGGIVTCENRELVRRGNQAGWDIMEFLGKFRSDSPDLDAQRSSAASVSQRQKVASSAARRPTGGSSSRSLATSKEHPSSAQRHRPASQQSQSEKNQRSLHSPAASPQRQRRHLEQGERRPSTEKFSSPPQRKTKPTQDVPQPVEDRLPEGLAPIRKIRQRNKETR